MRYLAALAFVLAGGCSLVVGFDQPAETGAQCSDGVDNDGNGDTDCEEASCAAVCGGVCGDEVVDDGEECDDGNDDNTDACLDSCLDATCGDGFVQLGVEECDDDNATPGDGCEASCAYTCAPGLIADGRALDPATGHCYLAFASPLDPPAAHEQCMALGGYLAVPDDAAENALIRGAAQDSSAFGIVDADIDAVYAFRVVTGDLPASFLPFTAGEPDAPLDAPICVGYDAALATWEDRACTEAHPYVCEAHVDPCGDLVRQPAEGCDDGNALDGDGCAASCTDEDECALGADNCSADAECINDVWSPFQPGFRCQCDPDFVGDGVSCVALPPPPTYAPQPPVAVSDTITDCTTAASHLGRKIGVDGGGFLYAVMLCPGAEAYAVRSLDGGATWTTPALIGAGVVEAAVQGMEPGRAVVAMILSTGEVVVRQTRDLATSWGPPRSVAPSSVPAGGVSLAADGGQLLVATRTAAGILRVHRGVDLELAAFQSVDTVTASTGDVLADPLASGVVWAVGDDGGYHLLASTDGGFSFPGPEATPSGTHAASDWAIGGGEIFVTGADDSIGVIDATAPGTSGSISGLPPATAGQRAIAAAPLGDAFVVQHTTGEGVQAILLPSGAAALEPPLVVDPAGESPSAIVLPGGLLAVVLTSGGEVKVAIVDLAPPPVAGLIHRWSFETDLLDGVGTAHGTVSGGTALAGGALVLDGIDGYFRSAPIDATIEERTLVAWVSLDNLTQQGGSALTLEDPTSADVFDAIVFGEGTAGEWFVGSDNGVRSASPFGAAETETTPSLVMIAYAYELDGTITAYRDGIGAAPYTPGPTALYPAGVADVLIGVRHDDVIAGGGTAGGADPYLAGQVAEARIYDRALTPLEIADLFAAGPDVP